jgi:peptidoglycan/LPS O-acetylase OafA/YrhL
VKRLSILDALRCVLAFCVTIGHHGMFPLFGPAGQANALADHLARALDTVVFGPPAVIAFFVISGFCIHYPYCQGRRRVVIGRFYARRYIRIGLPVIGVLVSFKVFFPETIIFGDRTLLWYSTLWSVVCEEIYYGAYPLLSHWAERWGWETLIGVAVFVSLCTTCLYFPARDWEDIGVLATTVTLLPVWLMGCQLAQASFSMRQDYSVKGIWIRRFCAWAMMWLALVLHFHAGIYQTATGLWLGVGYYFWLRAEICYYRNRETRRALAWAGQWSYSLYLVHPLVIKILSHYGILELEIRGRWIVGFLLILASSYAFYLLIERPSHKLARKIALYPREAAGRTLAYPESAT